MTTFKGFFKVDFVPPSVPQNLAAVVLSSSEIDLSWDASTDTRSGVAGYRLYRNGGLIQDLPDLIWSDTGLDPDTTYTYTISSYDNSGNESVQSGGINATTTLVEPIANDDNVNADEGATTIMDLAANDTENDNPIDLASIVITQAPTEGTITSVNANGTVDYEQNVPNATIDLFKYTIADTLANVSNIADVNVSIIQAAPFVFDVNQNSTSDSVVVIATPDHIEGDLLMAFIGSQGNGDIVYPGGWTTLDAWGTDFYGQRSWVGYKFASASESLNYSFSAGSPGGFIASFRNAGSVVNAAGSESSNLFQSKAPGKSKTVSSSLVVHWVMRRSVTLDIGPNPADITTLLNNSHGGAHPQAQRLVSDQRASTSSQVIWNGTSDPANPPYMGFSVSIDT